MSFERQHEDLAPLPVFYRRVAWNLVLAFLFIGVCLTIGTVGYHLTDSIPWIDAFHNASMILSGMGPVVDIHSTTGKIFSSCYAIFSGLAFITNIGIILTPVAHRFYHWLHAEDDDDEPNDS